MIIRLNDHSKLKFVHKLNYKFLIWPTFKKQSIKSSLFRLIHWQRWIQYCAENTLQSIHSRIFQCSGCSVVEQINIIINFLKSYWTVLNVPQSINLKFYCKPEHDVLFFFVQTFQMMLRSKWPLLTEIHLQV